jgi:hypothetical protein
MKNILLKWLEKLISKWTETMPDYRDEEPEIWDSMQDELKELKKIRDWANSL